VVAGRRAAQAALRPCAEPGRDGEGLRHPRDLDAQRRHRSPQRRTGGLTGALRQLFALAEAYPDLEASENYHTLQTQLDEIEGDIAVARQIYNDTTLTYNNTVETIPTNLVAQLANFESGPFFEVDDEGRSVPRVDL
jgi:hypothetical protein